MKFSIGGDRVSYPQCSGQLGGGVLILHGLYSVPELLNAAYSTRYTVNTVHRNCEFAFLCLLLVAVNGFSMFVCVGGRLSIRASVVEGCEIWFVLSPSRESHTE